MLDKRSVIPNLSKTANLRCRPDRPVLQKFLTIWKWDSKIFFLTSSTFKQNGCSTHRKILKALNTKHLSPIVFRYDMSSYNQKHFSSCRIKTNVSECSIMFYQHPCAPTHHVRCPKSNCQKWIALQSGIMDSQQNPHHATPSASTTPRFAWTLRAQDCLHLMEAQTGTLCF